MVRPEAAQSAEQHRAHAVVQTSWQWQQLVEWLAAEVANHDRASVPEALQQQLQEVASPMLRAAEPAHEASVARVADAQQREKKEAAR